MRAHVLSEFDRECMLETRVPMLGGVYTVFHVLTNKLLNDLNNVLNLVNSAVFSTLPFNSVKNEQ